MTSFSSASWGYKILSENQFSFYHVLLPKISPSVLRRFFPQIKNIEQQHDGSILIASAPQVSSQFLISEIVSFFEQKTADLLDTPNFYYKVDKSVRQTLKSWSLSFEGCLGLLLCHDEKLKEHLDGTFELINSRVGGLFLSPYTVFLYEDHAKILHPTTIANAETRRIIEQRISFIIRKMIKRLEEAQPGLEGLALVSMVETKTKLTTREIADAINEKSFGILTPTASPFFTA